MLNKRLIKAMVEAERLMDEGKIPFVMAPSPNGIMERLALNDALMEEFGLEQGQTINSMIRDAIIDSNIQFLAAKLDKLAQKLEDDLLDEDFDFRDYMNEGDNDATKH
mgnify:CR=1 FL=1